MPEIVFKLIGSTGPKAVTPSSGLMKFPVGKLDHEATAVSVHTSPA